MLILSRKARQSIHLGDNIVITITEVQGTRAQVAIQAPDDCAIVRGELLDQKPSADFSVDARQTMTKR